MRSRALALLASLIVVFSAAAPASAIGWNQREHFIFYYLPITSSTPLAKFGNAKVVVTSTQYSVSDDETTRDAKEAAAADRIQAAGALAYRYVNPYWMPRGREYQGMDIWENQDFIFCSSGSTPLQGRWVDTDEDTVDDGPEVDEYWYFLDLNELDARNYFSDWFDEIKDEWGYDGVFIDRGAAAFQGGKDIGNNYIWHVESTCSGDPVIEDRRFADAYYGIVNQANLTGLQVMLNYGTSPFTDPQLRPDPEDADCRSRTWGSCTVLSDIWNAIDWVLDESPVPNVPDDSSTNYQEGNWTEDETQNADNEADGRVVGLVKNANDSSDSTRKAQVFYQWARAALYDQPLAVNTGDDDCPFADPDDVCWRYGDPNGNPFPDLANSTLQNAQGSAPFTVACEGGSSTACIWVRRYGWGMVMLNRSSSTKASGNVSLNLASCKYIFKVSEQAFVSPNNCVTSVNRSLGAWTGIVLLYDEDGS